jgi:hypothetical protein
VTPSTPPLDIAGLVLSTLGIGTLVFTIIETPDRGWTEGTSKPSVLYVAR